ncbi:cupredoxin domain-containing protein [soil metagenome]
MTCDSTKEDRKRIDAKRRTMLLTAGALAVGAAPAWRSLAVAAGPRVIDIVAKKFVFVPAEIHVKQGETVTLRFTAPEVPMGFNLADFALRTDIVPGQVASLAFTPTKAGSFIFLCAVFCGSGHEAMRGTLIVS